MTGSGLGEIARVDWQRDTRHVASFVNVPLFEALRLISPEFLKDKKQLYSFIDRNPAYCAYQRLPLLYRPRPPPPEEFCWPRKQSEQ